MDQRVMLQVARLLQRLALAQQMPAAHRKHALFEQLLRDQVADHQHGGPRAHFLLGEHPARADVVVLDGEEACLGAVQLDVLGLLAGVGQRHAVGAEEGRRDRHGDPTVR